MTITSVPFIRRWSLVTPLQDQLPASPVFAPMQWKRAHLLWASLVMQGLLVGIWEFSYSNTFATYVYQFIVGFKIAQVRSPFANIFDAIQHESTEISRRLL